MPQRRRRDRAIRCTVLPDRVMQCSPCRKVPRKCFTMHLIFGLSAYRMPAVSCTSWPYHVTLHCGMKCHGAARKARPRPCVAMSLLGLLFWPPRHHLVSAHHCADSTVSPPRHGPNLATLNLVVSARRDMARTCPAKPCPAQPCNAVHGHTARLGVMQS